MAPVLEQAKLVVLKLDRGLISTDQVEMPSKESRHGSHNRNAQYAHKRDAITPFPVQVSIIRNLLNKHKAKHYGNVQRAKPQVEQEKDKITMVIVTYAIINPGSGGAVGEE